MNNTILLLTPYLGFIAKWLTDALKAIPWFSWITKDSTPTTKRLTASAFVALIVVACNFFNGTLDVTNLESLLSIIAELLGGSFTAMGSHDVMKK
jgi:hypothetical protein